MLRTVWKKLRRNTGAAKPGWTVWVHSSGFSVVPISPFAQETSVKWDKVQDVVAYKVDCYVHDQIRLTIQYDGGQHITITEEYPGYAEWVQAAETHLPGMRKDWFNEVTFPPFARNETVLFRR